MLIVHRHQIDDFCNDILKCCIETGVNTIPLRKKCNGEIVGWNDTIKPEREHSLFWHWLWLECGKPNHGYVYDIMKRTRARYHYAIRCAKRNEYETRKLKLASTKCGSSDMWRELKKISPIAKNIPSTVDEACGGPEIAELFVEKYETLYNSVPTSKKELDIIRADIASVLGNSICNVDISVTIISKCVRKLKAGKRDGGHGFDSDHLINGSVKLFHMIRFLFNAMIVHGYTANELLHSTIISIPKNLRSSLCSSDNYRGIALCCSLCKLLDLIILDMYGNYLYTSDLQFGFKPGLSTTLCTAVFIETVDYYVRKGGNVYSCLLDASKAFDKVHYGKLFKLLIDRSMPSLIVRLLLDSYTRQQLCVSWDSSISRYFNVSNGVKQGGVISPILFIVYFDELIVLLRNSGFGCHVGTQFVGALGYADDLTLICPSLNSLNHMLSICTDFAKQYNIVFNAKKTMGIKFGAPVSQQDSVYLNDNIIQWRDQVRHLGNIVNSNLSDLPDCKVKCSTFNGSVNKLFGTYKGLKQDTMCQLFRSYCCSFYGSQLWDFKSEGFNKCCIQWNKAVRRLFNLNYRTHTWILGPLLEQPHISRQLHVKTLHFLYHMLQNGNNVVASIGKMALSCATSPIGRNMSYLRHMFDIRFTESLSQCINRVHRNTNICSEYKIIIDHVKSLLSCIQGTSYIDGFDNRMINILLTNLCIE